MEDFVYRGKEVEFLQATGEVLGSNKYSETHISSSGGGGYVGKYGGNVSAPQVHSTAVTNHEFWIKTEDGVEVDIKLKGVDIPLRVGQKISVIAATIKGSESMWYSVLVNHSAGKHWFINKADDLNKLLKLEPLFTGKSLIIAGLIFFAIAGFTAHNDFWEIDNDYWEINWHYASWDLALSIAGTFVVYRLGAKLVRLSKLNKSLTAHLEKLVQSAYQEA